MEHAFNQYQSNQQFDQSNLESRKSKLETQLDKIEEDMRNFKLLLGSSVEISNFLKDPTQSIPTQNNFVTLLAEKMSFSKTEKVLQGLL